MAIWVAMLRSINVGGHNRIKMDELRRQFAAIGLGQVQTYIQSGNVLFTSDEEQEPLRQQIEHQLLHTAGIATTAILRTAGELGEVISHCPFTEAAVLAAEASSGAESLYVSMLLEPLPPEMAERLSGARSNGDEYLIRGRDVYLLCRHGIRASKLADKLQQLDVPSTVRNWKTINHLATLAKGLDVGSG